MSILTAGTVQNISNRWADLKSERSSWMPHWREISKYLMPRSGHFFEDDYNRGESKYNNIIDSTAINALGGLASAMMSGATSPTNPWFKLSAPDPALNDFYPVRVWLDEVADRMMHVFQRSNTYRVLHSMYYELIAFGTAGAFVMRDIDNVICLYPMTIGEYAITTDYKGRVNTVYRETVMYVNQLVDEFGFDNCSPSTQSAFNSGTFDQKVKVIHAIEPRALRDRSKINNLNMAYASYYFEASETGTNKFLRESGFDDFPAIVPRWDVRVGDVYGNSPGMVALGDIKQLQAEQYAKGKGINYQVNPPLQVPSNMKEYDLDFTPGGISFVDPVGPGIRPSYEVPLNLSYLVADIQEIQQRIREIFFANTMLMLTSPAVTRMTATEVAERHSEKLLMLGPVIERLQNEMLSPLIDRTFDHMITAGLIPPVPPELLGMNLSVEYVSMLAQAQKAVSTNTVDRFLGTIGSLASMKPEVLDNINPDAVVNFYSDMNGVPANIIYPADQVNEVRQARLQAQQSAEQANMISEQAKTAVDLSQAETGEGTNALMDVLGGNPQMTGFLRGVN